MCIRDRLNGVSIRTDNGNTLDVPCGCLPKLVAEPAGTGEKTPVYDLPFHEADVYKRQVTAIAEANVALRNMKHARDREVTAPVSYTHLREAAACGGLHQGEFPAVDLIRCQ